MSAPEDKVANVQDTLAEVGEDKVKAQAALEAELARGDDARSTLVAKLQAIVTAVEPDDQVDIVLVGDSFNGADGDERKTDAETAANLVHAGLARYAGSTQPTEG